MRSLVACVCDKCWSRMPQCRLAVVWWGFSVHAWGHNDRSELVAHAYVGVHVDYLFFWGSHNLNCLALQYHMIIIPSQTRYGSVISLWIFQKEKCLNSVRKMFGVETSKTAVSFPLYLWAVMLLQNRLNKSIGDYWREMWTKRMCVLPNDDIYSRAYPKYTVVSIINNKTWLWIVWCDFKISSTKLTHF